MLADVVKTGRKNTGEKSTVYCGKKIEIADYSELCNLLGTEEAYGGTSAFCELLKQHLANCNLLAVPEIAKAIAIYTERIAKEETKAEAEAKAKAEAKAE